MADNYLERKMEEHRNGGVPVRRKLTPSGQRPGKLLLDFPPLRVYVIGGGTGTGASIVKALCDAGCRVAFCDADTKSGTATAQRCGAQFHPINFADVVALEASLRRVEGSWGPIELVITANVDIPAGCAERISGACARILCVAAGDAPQGFEACPNANAIVVPAGGIDDKTLTTMLIILASPAAANIRSQTFRL